MLITVNDWYNLNNSSSDEKLLEFFVSKLSNNSNTAQQLLNSIFVSLDTIAELKSTITCGICGSKLSGKLTLPEGGVLSDDVLKMSFEEAMVNNITDDGSLTSKASILQAIGVAEELSTLTHIYYKGHCIACGIDLIDRQSLYFDRSKPLCSVIRKVVDDFALNNTTLVSMSCSLGRLYSCNPASYFSDSTSLKLFLDVFEHSRKEAVRLANEATKIKNKKRRRG